MWLHLWHTRSSVLLAYWPSGPSLADDGLNTTRDRWLCLLLCSRPCMQSCLLDQRFVLDDSVTVQQLLSSKSKGWGLPGEQQ